ncbi:MAG: hypothetical protein PHO14_03885 [Kiritimatiellae bacterium]|nr:hypothetical protein [Kiritimatiellia bacterium]MDD4341357.1 hypothetical protein [Kiritimatiellia bacterium]
MRELAQQMSVLGLGVCGVLSLWPFPFSRRWQSWHLYLPVAGLALYAVFELALPTEVELGWRMSAVVAVLLFLWLNGIAKVALLAVLMEKTGGRRHRLRREPQRLWQGLLAIPLVAICAVWCWRSLA